MPSPISTFFAHQILDRALPDQVFVSLHTGDPGEAGAYELTGRGYKRAEGSGAFGSAVDRTRLNTRDIAFTDLPKTEATHVALWDAELRGNLLISGKLSEIKIIFDGDAVRFLPGALEFAFD